MSISRSYDQPCQGCTQPLVMVKWRWEATRPQRRRWRCWVSWWHPPRSLNTMCLLVPNYPKVSRCSKELRTVQCLWSQFDVGLYEKIEFGTHFGHIWHPVHQHVSYEKWPFGCQSLTPEPVRASLRGATNRVAATSSTSAVPGDKVASSCAINSWRRPSNGQKPCRTARKAKKHDEAMDLLGKIRKTTQLFTCFGWFERFHIVFSWFFLHQMNITLWGFRNLPKTK